MKWVLGGDIGGTNTRLRLAQLTAPNNNVLIAFEQRYDSERFDGLGAIVKTFLKEARDAGAINAPSHACFAVAGPVISQDSDVTSVITKLPWRLSVKQLQASTEIPNITLINDFVAIGHGVAACKRSDDLVIYSGGPNRPKRGNKAVIGAGTGLGICQIFYGGKSPFVCPSEGGHIEFGPQNEEQIALLQFMQREYGHVSYDRLVSGPGIVDIFRFIAKRDGHWDSPVVASVMSAPDPAIAVSEIRETNALAKNTIDLFIKLYGAIAGNVALLTLPEGGLYLAGGIAPQLESEIQSAGFINAFLNKGRLSHAVERTRVVLIRDVKVGLAGAVHVAAQM